MPPRKKTAIKKAAPKKKQQDRITVIETREVPLSDLQVFHQNPRVGNVDKIAKSLHINGLYRPIVVNIGTHTGRENEILAGNHTYLGARKPLFWQAGGETYDKPAWDTILCSFVDVDDEAAAQIVIADNKTADDGTYDETVLAELVSGLPDINAAGTGYDPEEWGDLISNIDIPDADLDSSLDDLEDHIEEMEKENEKNQPKKKPKFSDVELGDEVEDVDDDEPTTSVREKIEEKKARPKGIDLDSVSSEQEGVHKLANDPYFDYVESKNGNQYPRLLGGKHLMTRNDLPEDLDLLRTWAGSATREDEESDRVWFYNYGVDSTSGMLPDVLPNSIISFFTWDDYFEGWWQQPAKFVTKCLNTGIKLITTPDFTPQTEMGNIFLHWQLYRQRYLGRYFQEAGMKLLPHLLWPDGDMEFLQEETLPTLPKDIPMLLMQAQTLDPKNVIGGMDWYIEQLQTAIDYVKPKTILLYAGQPGFDIFDNELKLEGIEVIKLEHRQSILSAANKAKKRKKKTTL
jgi:Domain of unknown function (DUF4417)